MEYASMNESTNKHIEIKLDSPSAVALLYQQHAAKIFTYIQQHVPSFEDAEDILVEVFVAALENAEIFTWEEKIQQAWLWRVTHNKMIDLYRRTKRSPTLPLSAFNEDAFEHDIVSPEQSSIRGEEDAQLHALIGQLSPLQQEILQLRFAYDLRSTQIASKIGKRDGTVRSILSRTLNQLRHLYEKQ
jgi:RNA polymerase sigma factor (sigma-70 family)